MEEKLVSPPETKPRPRLLELKDAWIWACRTSLPGCSGWFQQPADGPLKSWWCAVLGAEALPGLPTVGHPAPLWVQSGQRVNEPALDFGRGVTSQDTARGTMSGRREVVVRGVACLPSLVNPPLHWP